MLLRVDSLHRAQTPAKATQTLIITRLGAMKMESINVCLSGCFLPLPGTYNG